MYSIHPIKCGTLTAPKSAITYRVDFNTDLEFAVYAFLVIVDDPNDDTVILVDTGLMAEDTEYMRGRERSVGPPGGGSKPLLAGLETLGYMPPDVDLVVLTHLHHDHTANINLFEDAEFVIQRSEMAAAHDPLPIVATPYREGTLSELEDRNVTIVDGDTMLREGIDLVYTPGHTEGMQSVLIETSEGPCALIGDLAYNQHNLNPRRKSIVDASGHERAVTPKEIPYIPPGTHVDIAACYESIAIVRERVGPFGRLISTHDSEAVNDL